MSNENVSVELSGVQLKAELGFLSAQTIITHIKKSELSLTEQTVLITIVTNITNMGIRDVKKLLSLAYESLSDTPELFNKLIEIINQSC